MLFRLYPSSLSTSEQANTTTSCLNKLRALGGGEAFDGECECDACFDQLFLEMRGDLVMQYEVVGVQFTYWEEVFLIQMVELAGRLCFS